MSTWIKKTVEASEIENGKLYFLARRPINAAMASWYYLSRDKHGKEMMSSKPGIAKRIVGNDALRDVLCKHPDHVAIEVPADADTRWRRRR